MAATSADVLTPHTIKPVTLSRGNHICPVPNKRNTPYFKIAAEIFEGGFILLFLFAQYITNTDPFRICQTPSYAAR